jgi:progressive ankylosis protein
MRVRTVCMLWLPLAVSFELMMLEGPAVQAAIGRLPNAPLNFAAWGLTMSLSLIVESPVIMLIATAIALVKDADSFCALRRFVINLSIFCTALTAAVAFTPLFGLIAGRWMKQPAAFVAAAQPAMQIMLLWTAAIAWRRFYQGVLVRHGHTRTVTYGTAVRLVAAVATAVDLARWGALPGVQVGAWALMAAVVTEAVVTTVLARRVVRQIVLTAPDSGTPPLTQRDILRFHTPLAATTLLTLLAQPLTAAALARLDQPELTLAALPVTFMLLLVLRGWGLALQEITVSLARKPQAAAALRRFTWIVAVTCTLAALVMTFTPLLGLYLNDLIRMPANLQDFVRAGLSAGLMLPAITALSSWVRGLLVASGRTNIVYRGMAANLCTHAALLAGAVLLHLPGMWVATGAFTLAAVVEYAYLVRAEAGGSGGLLAPVEAAFLEELAGEFAEAEAAVSG